MRRFLAIAMLAFAAVWMSGCGAPATNAPANTNTNANSKPVAAAPTADALLALDKDATDKYLKGDATAFETILSDKAVMAMGDKRMGKAGIVDMIKTVKCENAQVNLSEPQMSKINDDTYAITYKDDSTGKCTENGKTMDIKPMRAATVWVRNGDKWQAAWHAENVIMAPPASDKKADAGNTESKKEDKAAAAEPKKEEKATEPKKEDKAADIKDAKPAANSNANTTAASEPAKLTPSANTDALAKMHAAGWEAFRNKDAKAFDSMMTSTFAGVGPDGSFWANKADTIKTWTETMKCEGITKTSFTDAFAQAISPTVEILFGKGNADGTCDGHKNGDLWQTAVYVKEGDAWKLAFMMEQMPGSGM